MLIGLDLDNTLIGYDESFALVAAEMGLVPAGWRASKSAVRERVRLGPGGEAAWRRLQGQVYGPRLALARLVPGAEDFILRARALGHSLVIVSHKTRFGHDDDSGTDLRQAALAWMDVAGFFTRLGFSADDIHFADDRAAKLARIAALGCAVFIDDLVEVLHDSAFPAATRGVLLEDWATVTREVLP